MNDMKSNSKNKKDILKYKIIDYVREHPGTSFVEIERVFEKCGFDFDGERGIYSPLFPNIVLWGNWNSAACGVVKSLLNDGILVPVPTTALTYIIDGKMPDFPIAETLCAYTTTHWLPVTFSLNPSQG
jgi:hypothetical protein